MICMVQKKLQGTRLYLPGRLVNTSEWDPIRRDQLISQRYIRLATTDEVTEAKEKRKIRRHRQLAGQ